MKLKDLGELGLIQRFAPLFAPDFSQGIEGIGDDCAIFPLRENFSALVTTDLLVENTHFIKEQISPADLGHKSLAVNLSDIAAMGGKPLYAFLSLALPQDMEVNWIDAFFRGFKQLADTYQVLLLGGDTTRSNLIAVNVLIMGEIETQRIKRRSAAQPGDLICCTGDLGDSGAGLKILRENLPRDDLAQLLVNAHFLPRPHLQEGAWLARQAGVHAMMDLSDGIASDMQRICEASRCGAKIEIDRLPLSKSLQKASQAFGWQATDLALSAGEDYCLLLTVDPDHFQAIAHAFEKNFERPLHQIGKILANLEFTYTNHKKKCSITSQGFDHFKSS